jgi:hypothetical protein
MKHKAFSLRNIKKLAIKAMIRTFLPGFFRSGNSLTLSASMTVEATLALPLFIFLMMSILYFFQVINIQTKALATVHQEGNNRSLNAYGDPDQAEEEIVYLVDRYPIESFLFWTAFDEQYIEQHYYGHAWIGYDVSQEAYDYNNGKNLSVPYVFIAETGTVYHWLKDCTYLDRSINSVEANEIESLRNNSGGIYYACELCMIREEDKEIPYYLTKYGNRYHSDLFCSVLKRTIYRVSISKALEQERSECSRCKENEDLIH